MWLRNSVEEKTSDAVGAVATEEEEGWEPKGFPLDLTSNLAIESRSKGVQIGAVDVSNEFYDTTISKGKIFWFIDVNNGFYDAWVKINLTTLYQSMQKQGSIIYVKSLRHKIGKRLFIIMWASMRAGSWMESTGKDDKLLVQEVRPRNSPSSSREGALSGG
jgi:hypothetical protein